MKSDPEHDWNQAGPPPDSHQHERAGDHRATNGHAHASPDDVGTAVAIGFLERFQPGAPWALASFDPGGGEVGPAQTFDPLAEKDAAFEFIRKLQGRNNVYFAVNFVGARIAKKAAKQDIIEIHYLHVDADLPKTLNWSDPIAVYAAKKRALEQLRAYGRPPTLGSAPDAHFRGPEHVNRPGQPHDPIDVVARICAKCLLDAPHTPLDGRHKVLVAIDGDDLG